MPSPACGQVADEAPPAHRNGTTRRPEPDVSHPGSPTSAKPGSLRNAVGIAAPEPKLLGERGAAAEEAVAGARPEDVPGAVGAEPAAVERRQAIHRASRQRPGSAAPADAVATARAPSTASSEATRRDRTRRA